MKRTITLVRVGLLLAAMASLLAASASAAQAAAPAWKLTATALPTVFLPGSSSADFTGGNSYYSLPQYSVVATNIGGADTSGPVTITDTLPAGVTPTPGYPPVGRERSSAHEVDCVTSGQTVTCTAPGPIPAGSFVQMVIPVDVAATTPATVEDHAAVAGGGASTIATSTSTAVSVATPTFAFLPGDSGLSTVLTDASGSAVTQAGAHPYQLTLDAAFPTRVSEGNPSAAGHLRNLAVTLPQGVVVDPGTTPVRCQEAQLEQDNYGGGCPAASQVGTVTVTTFLTSTIPVVSPLYNMVPPPGKPAELAFDGLGIGIYVHLDGGVDAAGNYALTATAKDVLARPGNPVLGIKTQLWGDPSDPSHDALRGFCLDHDGLSSTGGPCTVAPSTRPFLTLPSACSGPLSTTISASSWESSSVSRTVQTEAPDGTVVGVTGCEKLHFTPTISVTPQTTVADTPTGIDVDLQVPQSTGINTLATANLKDATVTLPAGVSVNPSSADGLAACSSAQIHLGENVEAACPSASAIGTVEVTTPLLDDPLKGSIYLAAQNDNPSHSVLGLYLTAVGSGVDLKLAGHVQADRATGRLTATFDDNPQLPFSELRLHLKSGARAPLATPDACGTYASTASLTPWSGTPAVTSTDPFVISSGCDGGFTPGFSAGVTNPSAGQDTSFTLNVSRADGEQHIRSLTTTLPSGLLARIGSVALCGDAAAAAGTCGVGAQIGSTDAAAGPGSNPFHIAGKVYLTGPYKGAPYGLSIVVPALAGPFNLGTVVVRAALKIDPIDAHVTAVSDDVPDLLAVTGADGDSNGFPLRVRSIAVTIDRPAFMLNPTSCAPTSIGATLGSWAGASSSASSRFQVGDCQALGLSPKLAISLTGKGQTTDDKHPGVHAVVSQTKGQANLKKVVVSLPLSLALDPDNAQALCEFTDGSKVDPTCPKGSIVGKAVARTPILDQPLSGPVYFVKNVRKDPKSGREIRTLPKLVIPLTGENGLRLNLVGTSNVVDNRLVTTFDNIPDAPVSDFTLDIDGGKSGILVVSGTDICKSTQVAEQQVDGQNGKTADADVYLQTLGCSLKILSKKVGKTSVAVKVGGLGAGKVTVTGKGIKKTTKTISKSTVVTVTAKRTKGTPGKVTVSFDPTGPAKAHKTTK